MDKFNHDFTNRVSSFQTAKDEFIAAKNNYNENKKILQENFKKFVFGSIKMFPGSSKLEISNGRVDSKNWMSNFRPLVWDADEFSSITFSNPRNKLPESVRNAMAIFTNVELQSRIMTKFTECYNELTILNDKISYEKLHDHKYTKLDYNNYLNQRCTLPVNIDGFVPEGEIEAFEIKHKPGQKTMVLDIYIKDVATPKTQRVYPERAKMIFEQIYWHLSKKLMPLEP